MGIIFKHNENKVLHKKSPPMYWKALFILIKSYLSFLATSTSVNDSTTSPTSMLLYLSIFNPHS
jgi:hypothetical protein